VGTMKFGIAFANIGPFIEPERACALARSAEEAGFESIWTVDHVVVPSGYRSTYPYDPSGRLPSGEDAPFPDPLIWLAYVARETSTIRLATGILILPQRNPLILAKELATLDHLSSGRVTLGVGIGWLQEEFDALGVPFENRGQRTEEAIAAMRALWSQERASFDGATVGFRDVYLRPQPPGGAIPIHIGGHSEVAAQRAGRIGDGFFPFGVDGDVLAGLVGTMNGAARASGRDPSSVELTVSSYSVGDDEAVAEVQALGALGATRVVVPAAMFGPDPDRALMRYGENVIGRLSA
jgi:probable F420-dependent oxidoreductase